MLEKKDLINKIRKILLQNWDPIGVSQFANECNIEDEYDGYISTIYTLIKNKKIDQFIKKLNKIEEMYLGVTPSPKEKLIKLYNILLKEIGD